MDHAIPIPNNWHVKERLIGMSKERLFIDIELQLNTKHQYLTIGMLREGLFINIELFLTTQHQYLTVDMSREGQ